MIAYGEKYAAAQDKLENAKTNLAKAQKLVDLLKNYQEVPTPQVTVIHEIEKVPETSSPNINGSSNNSASSTSSPANEEVKNKTTQKFSIYLKEQIKSLKNGKTLRLKNKGYVATLKNKHPLPMVKFVKNKRTKLHTKIKPYKLYKVKSIKKFSDQIWAKISSKNEWVNIKYLTLFKKID